MLMRLLRTLTSAHAIALLALFVALGSTAGAAGLDLVTGHDVQDGSLTGADLHDRSVGGKKLRVGSVDATALGIGAVGTAEVGNGTLRARDFDLRRLPGVTRVTARHAPITNYTDFDPIASYRTKKAGDYIVFGLFSVTNTGSNNEYLNCGYQAAGNLFPAAGADTTAGQTTKAFPVTVVEVGKGGIIRLVCTGSGGTTYDLSNIRMRVLRLA
jgi:hypothetical protein